jgi:hypothetical protein
MRRWLIVLGLLWPCLVGAEDFVCGDATLMTRYLPSMDPSRVTDGTCTQISKANTPAQRALVQATPPRYLKVVGGLAVEMTQPEKDAVDAASAAQAAVRQLLLDELTTSATCNADTLATVNTRLATRKATLDAQIDGIAAANLASLKAGLHGVVDDEYLVFQAIARCLTALRKVLNR